MSRLESRSIASMASNVNINRLSNTSGVDLHRPRGMGNDVAGGQRTSSAVMATEAATQNEETKSALEMAAKLHNNLHDSNGLHHSNQFHGLRLMKMSGGYCFFVNFLNKKIQIVLIFFSFFFYLKLTLT